jgi:hypothetical protein
MRKVCKDYVHSMDEVTWVITGRARVNMVHKVEVLEPPEVVFIL